MDLTQTVAIPLDEYLELRELKENAKYVQFEQSTVVDVKSGREWKRRGGSVSWKSDGEAWADIAYLLEDSERRLDAISTSATEFIARLSHMSWSEFRQLKKTIKEAGSEANALSKLISGFEAYLPKEIPDNPYEDDSSEEESE